MGKRKRKHWSYNAGERGRNWVRTYRDSRDGKLYLEWLEPGWAFDPETELDTPIRRRKSRLLQGVLDEREAKIAADQKAAELGKSSPPSEAPIELSRLLFLYAKEVTPTKGEGKQQHDRRAIRLWISFFEAQEESNRKSERHPSSLDRTDWNRFIQWRREGLIPGWPAGVRNRQIQYDLKFLISVLNWATGHKEGGKPLLRMSPWRAEVRRSQGWEMPKEINPHRPGMTEELREGLLAHAPGWQFGLALILERETRRRNNSIRQLLWSDIDLEGQAVRWRSVKDKAGRESVTPLTKAGLEALRRAPSRGIGDTPVFPAGTDPSHPTPRFTFQTWLRRAKDNWLASVPEREKPALKERLKGVGFHAEKRAGVRDPEFRKLPPSVQEAFAGTRYETLRMVYDEVTVDDMREAMDLPKTASNRP